MQSLDNKKKVSVIIPTRNNAVSLSICIESILSQEYPDLEIIVVDNASIDNTREVVERFSQHDTRIKYVFEGVIGRGSARDSGNKIASGEILLFTDDDCIVGKDWILKMAEDIISGEYSAVQGYENNTINNYWAIQHQNRVDNVWDKEVGFVDTKNFAIRADILKRVGGIDRGLNALIDIDLYIRLIKDGVNILNKKNAVVSHNNPTDFRSVFKKNFIRGYWAFVLLNKYGDNMNSEIRQRLCLTAPSFFRYFVGVFINPFRKGTRYAFFDGIVGLAWRMGILYHLSLTFFKRK